MVEFFNMDSDDWNDWDNYDIRNFNNLEMLGVENLVVNGVFIVSLVVGIFSGNGMVLFCFDIDVGDLVFFVDVGFFILLIELCIG